MTAQTTRFEVTPPPSQRSTEFTAVGTTGEEFNGYTLMVEAYAAIWLILMVWFGLLWRRQQGLSARIDGLEQALGRAEHKLSAGHPQRTESSGASP